MSAVLGDALSQVDALVHAARTQVDCLRTQVDSFGLTERSQIDSTEPSQVDSAWLAACPKLIHLLPS